MLFRSIGLLEKQIALYEKALADKGEPTTETKKAEPEPLPDYGKDIQKIQEKIEGLDPDDVGYTKELAKYTGQIAKIAMTAGSEQGARNAIEAAQSEFSKVLNERDVQDMHKNFYQQNPEFKTPEMQVRIQEYMANDPTGMSDELVAFREIQRDDAQTRAQELEEQNAELQRLLDLKQGEEESGRVVTKGQSAAQQKTKQKKLTGPELDQAMWDAIDKVA